MVHYYEPERKSQNRVWVPERDNPPQTAKRNQCQQTVPYKIFFDSSGIMLNKKQTKKGRASLGNTIVCAC